MIVQLYDGSFAHWPSGDPAEAPAATLPSAARLNPGQVTRTAPPVVLRSGDAYRNDSSLFFEEFETIAEMGCRTDLYHFADDDTVLAWTLAALRRGQAEYRYTPFQYAITRQGLRWSWAAARDIPDGLSAQAGLCWSHRTAIRRAADALRWLGR